jgi:ADP-heptose:LPS heptosyltransferase
MKTTEKNPKFIIIFPGTLGDLILATPMFSAIKEKFPDSEITLISGNSNYTVVKDNPKIDKIHKLNKQPLKLLSLIRKLRTQKFDYHIDPKDHKSRESQILAWITNADTKIGYNIPGKAEVFDLLIPNVEDNKELHFIQKCFRPLKYLDIELPEEYIPRPELYTNPDSEKYLKGFFEENMVKDYIVVNISASNEYKMYDNKKWVKIIDYLRRNGFDVVLSFAPSEKEKAKSLKEHVKKLKLFKSRSFKDTIALIKNTKLLITPDTSLVHVSSAFNIPMIGLYDHYDAGFVKFRPLADIASIIRSKDTEKGIKSIKANDVLKIFEEIKDVL